MTHNMNLQNRYFDYIKNGTKRIELRLLDEKRKLIKIGDKIIFSRGSDKDEYLETKVIGLIYYNSFEDLFNDFDISILSDSSMTKEELLEELEIYYTKEQQSELGVVGIRIELI